MYKYLTIFMQYLKSFRNILAFILIFLHNSLIINFCAFDSLLRKYTIEEDTLRHVI